MGFCFVNCFLDLGERDRTLVKINDLIIHNSHQIKLLKNNCYYYIIECPWFVTRFLRRVCNTTGAISRKGTTFPAEHQSSSPVFSEVHVVKS